MSKPKQSKIHPCNQAQFEGRLIKENQDRERLERMMKTKNDEVVK